MAKHMPTIFMFQIICKINGYFTSIIVIHIAAACRNTSECLFLPVHK